MILWQNAMLSINGFLLAFVEIHETPDVDMDAVESTDSKENRNTAIQSKMTSYR